MMRMAPAVLPSGIWSGSFRQHGIESPQNMTLEFADGIIRGDGTDRVGEFTIDGEYRVDDGATRLGWIKTYGRGHSVLYLGRLDDQRIVGRWSVRGFRGKFSLFPARSGLL